MNSEFARTWDALLPALRSAYVKAGRGDLLQTDLPYLSEAFTRVEYFWHSQAKAIRDLRLVMLSEAPLFGPDHLYFYNPSARATEFFSYLDGEALVGRLAATSKLVEGMRPRKALMIEKLTNNGFLILDLFPFALKPNFTTIDYAMLRHNHYYHTLFIETAPHYLSPKLRLLAKGAKPKRLVFVFRYAGLRDNLQQAVRSLLVSHDFLRPGQRLESVHQGRNVDRNRLAKLFKAGSPEA